MDSALIHRYKLYHIIFWIVLFSGWYYFRYQDFSTTNKALLITFIKVADLAVMVYVTNYLLIPKLLYRKRYLFFAIAFFLMITISSLFKLYLIGNILNPFDGFILFDSDFKTRVYDNVIPHFLLVSTGAAFKLLIDYANAQKRIAEMAKEKSDAELSFLKSQMNPHFLFNSLNAVYFLIDKNNNEARQALHKFSDMLRYQLYEVKDDKIPIEKEIGYLKDYIGIQQLRRDNCCVKMNIQNNLKSFCIEPLLLLPFVENSFKHLSDYNNKEQNRIEIDISKKDGEMCFIVNNTSDVKNISAKEEAGGIGMKNVKRRLELLYPQKHKLNVSETAGWFNVNLRLKINEN